MDTDLCYVLKAKVLQGKCTNSPSCSMLKTQTSTVLFFINQHEVALQTLTNFIHPVALCANDMVFTYD